MMILNRKHETVKIRWVCLFLVIVVFLALSCKEADEAVERPENSQTAVNNQPVPTSEASNAGSESAPTAAIKPSSLSTTTPTAVPAATPANTVIINPTIELPNTHQTGDGRLVVNFPDGWYSSGLRKPGETVNNAALSNNTRGFTGDSGQILVQIFEPVYVMELFGIADTSQVTLEDVYTVIVNNNEQDLREYGHEPQYLSLNGRELLRLDFILPQYDTMMLSLRSSDGYIVQLNAVMAPGELDQFEEVVMAIAATLDYTAPDRDIPEDSPAAIVRSHFEMVESGNLQDIQNLYCIQDLIIFGIFNDSVMEATDIEISDETFETIAGFAQAMAAPDFSYLFYQTVVSEEEEEAIVRVSGNVIINNSAGEPELIPYLEFTPAQTDGWPLIWEDNQWKICVTS